MGNVKELQSSINMTFVEIAEVNKRVKTRLLWYF